MSETGRRPYTDEPVVRVTAHFLADAEEQWRLDAARYRVTLGAFYIELSRLYSDAEVRRTILRRVLERAGQPVPDELT